MAIWPFNRHQNQSVSPELQDLYQAERRDRLSAAWLLGLGTLLATVALAAGLFFGGRWVWRQFDNNKDKNTEQTASQDQKDTKPMPVASNPTPAPQPAPTTPTPSPTPKPPATQPKTTPTTGPLPSTGPEDTLAIFVAVTALGVIAHQLYLRRATDR